MSVFLTEEQAERCHRWPSVCCYSTLVWQMSNGSNYITGKESRLTLSCDLRFSLQSCCGVQGAAEHWLLYNTAIHHACTFSVATPIYSSAFACQSITWKRDRGCKKPQSENGIESISFTQLMQKATNCIKGLYSLSPDRSAAIHKRAWKNNSSWLHVLMHLCSCNHFVSSRL